MAHPFSVADRDTHTATPQHPARVPVELARFAGYMNPRRALLSAECPQLNAAPLFGSQHGTRLGFPDVHPSVSMWGHDTYLTGWVVVGAETAIYPGCNFMGDALVPLTIGKRCSLQHVELHLSGFRMLPTTIGDDTFMSHLCFGHSVTTGSGCYILGHVTMYDGAEIGDDVFIQGNSTILGSARLLSGWAYHGTVDRDTQPLCRTSEVEFGLDPQTGSTLYIGGERGVAATVNLSHVRRNETQMQLAAIKHGLPELQAPAYAMLIPHVWQSGSYYLGLAALVLDQMRAALREISDYRDIVLRERLADDCRALCGCIRTIYDGAAASEQAGLAWRRRSSSIEQIVALLDADERTFVVDMPALGHTDVVLETDDLRTMSRKLVEFDQVVAVAERAAA